KPEPGVAAPGSGGHSVRRSAMTAQLQQPPQPPLNLSKNPQPQPPHLLNRPQPLNLPKQPPLPPPPPCSQVGAHAAGAGAWQTSSTHGGTILHTVTVSHTGTHSVTHLVAW